MNFLRLFRTFLPIYIKMKENGGRCPCRGGFFATNNPPAVTRQPGDADHNPFLLQNIAVSACASEHPDKIIHILENIGQNKEGKDEQNDTAGDDDAKGKPVGSSLPLHSGKAS